MSAASATRIENICQDIVRKYPAIFDCLFSSDKVISIYNIACTYTCNPVIITKILRFTSGEDVRIIKSEIKIKKKLKCRK